MKNIIDVSLVAVYTHTDSFSELRNNMKEEYKNKSYLSIKNI